MTTEAAPTPKRVRRAPGDLTLPFPTAADARAIAALTGEPAWLAEDRAAAAEALAELPIEPNRLYTGYVDFRHAELAPRGGRCADRAGRGRGPIRRPLGRRPRGRDRAASAR